MPLVNSYHILVSLNDFRQPLTPCILSPQRSSGRGQDGEKPPDVVEVQQPTKVRCGSKWHASVKGLLEGFSVHMYGDTGHGVFMSLGRGAAETYHIPQRAVLKGNVPDLLPKVINVVYEMPVIIATMTIPASGI